MQATRRPRRKRRKLHDLSGVGSVGIVARGPLDEYRFNMFMKDLLAEKTADIYRCKGVLCVHVCVCIISRRLLKQCLRAVIIIIIIIIIIIHDSTIHQSY